MTIKDIAALRLVNQHIASGNHFTPKQLVSAMGAMQAQDFAMVRWAIGLRLPGSTISEINEAVDSGELIRTHLLRPTWHFVVADDLRWMLSLSAQRIKATLKYRQHFLSLTPDILAKSNAVINDLLKGKHLSKEEISVRLKKESIDTDENRISHILLWAELSEIICSGIMKANKPTYTLIEERVPAQANPGKEEMLRKLASRYFTSHGPATINDFAWWSGLSVREIRTSLELASGELESSEVDKTLYWFGKDLRQVSGESRAWLLPAYDEFIISYVDRTSVLSQPYNKKAISSNGIFRPVVILGNHVAGLWRPVKVKDSIMVELNLFKKVVKSERTAIESAAESYGRFLGKKTEVKYI